MLILYQLIIGTAFVVLFPFLLLFVLVTGIHRELFHERLGLYKEFGVKGKRTRRIWLHGASVGEVKAISVLVGQLKTLVPDSQFVVTTMTVTGKEVAQQQLGEEVICLLTPLDVPLIVNRVVRVIDPDCYICIETELWPVLLSTLASKGIPTFLVNGRMSENSRKNYLKFRMLFSRVINSFDRLSFISDEDRQRFISLGGDPDKMRVDGNIKYDLPIPEKAKQIRRNYQNLLSTGEDEETLIGGSTHHGEEDILVDVWKELNRNKPLLLIIAPRHLERVAEIEAMLIERSLAFHTFSALKNGEQRCHPIVLLDTLGELSLLYSIATFIFCGGSLVDYGGHNVMEAAIWDKVVLYGPDMADFLDGKKLLESVGGGVMVNDAHQLMEQLKQFRSDPASYEYLCRGAGTIARAQQGTGQRQALLVVETLLQ